MIFYACVQYDEHEPETYRGITVTTLGDPSDVVTNFESYDPLEDYRNFVSWSESVGQDNIAFCDSIKHFAKDYQAVSEDAATEMITMVYGEHGNCE